VKTAKVGHIATKNRRDFGSVRTEPGHKRVKSPLQLTYKHSHLTIHFRLLVAETTFVNIVVAFLAADDEIVASSTFVFYSWLSSSMFASAVCIIISCGMSQNIALSLSYADLVRLDYGWSLS